MIYLRTIREKFICFKFRAGDEKPLLQDEKIVALSEKYKKNAGQVVIKYLLQRGLIVIPKSVTPSRIQGNIQVICES